MFQSNICSKCQNFYLLGPLNTNNLCSKCTPPAIIHKIIIPTLPDPTFQDSLLEDLDAAQKLLKKNSTLFPPSSSLFPSSSHTPPHSSNPPLLSPSLLPPFSSLLSPSSSLLPPSSSLLPSSTDPPFPATEVGLKRNRECLESLLGSQNDFVIPYESISKRIKPSTFQNNDEIDSIEKKTENYQSFPPPCLSSFPPPNCSFPALPSSQPSPPSSFLLPPYSLSPPPSSLPPPPSSFPPPILETKNTFDLDFTPPKEEKTVEHTGSKLEPSKNPGLGKNDEGEKKGQVDFDIFQSDGIFLTAPTSSKKLTSFLPAATIPPPPSSSSSSSIPHSSRLFPSSHLPPSSHLHPSSILPPSYSSPCFFCSKHFSPIISFDLHKRVFLCELCLNSGEVKSYSERNMLEDLKRLNDQLIDMRTISNEFIKQLEEVERGGKKRKGEKRKKEGGGRKRVGGKGNEEEGGKSGREMEGEGEEEEGEGKMREKRNEVRSEGEEDEEEEEEGVLSEDVEVLYKKIFRFFSMSALKRADPHHKKVQNSKARDVFLHSKLIATKEDEIFILNLFPVKLKRTDVILLYRASLHGFSSASFHRRCDRKGPTLTIIKSKRGYLFGGFASISWKSKVKYSRREELRRKSYFEKRKAKDTDEQRDDEEEEKQEEENREEDEEKEDDEEEESRKKKEKRRKEEGIDEEEEDEEEQKGKQKDEDEGKEKNEKREGVFAKDERSFLFSLTHRTKHEIIRLTEKALFFCEEYGPVWGAGYDLCIKDGGKACFANLGISYEGGGEELRKWLGGEIVFDIEDYEVFGLNVETRWGGE